ncbi:MAG: c-type cytochrome [Kiloniellales bacterium]
MRRFALALCLVVFTSAAGSAAGTDPALRRGEYVFRAAGCVSCHTDLKNKGPRLAGGRALKTPFGTFYGPNITPDTTHGIGAWTEADFVRALRRGVSPDGAHYFPAFPYAAYTRMTNADLRALWAYLRAQPPVERPNRPHDLRFPFNLRFLIGPWKWLYFEPGPQRPEAGRSAAWNRGAYLVEALGHCAECHTPRTLLGGLDRDRHMAGTRDGPEGKPVPNITPDAATGIGDWSRGDVTTLLKFGMLPDGEFVGGLMAEVVEHSTRYLTPEDRAAIVDYIRSLPAIHNDLRPADKGGS